jgi:hypothetical protein
MLTGKHNGKSERQMKVYFTSTTVYNEMWMWTLSLYFSKLGLTELRVKTVAPLATKYTVGTR